MEKTPRGRRRSQAEDKLAKTNDGSDVQSSSSSSSSDSLPLFVPSWLIPIVAYLSDRFSWVPPNLAWSKLKPAIRCAIVAWISLVLFVIPKVQMVMGQASFLILIAVILSPPSDPFLSVLERELLILIFACTAWAWCCLGLFLANLARRVHNPTATIFLVVDGRYIEAAPSIIIGIFIFFGSATLVGFKAKQGPGPYLFPCVLSCLVINIALTTGALFPFPFYSIGQTILIPLSIHSALSLLASLLIFPATISALFTNRLSDALTPVLLTLASHNTILSTPLTSPSFPTELASLRSNTKKCESILVPLAAARRLLHNDVIYGRFAPEDFTAFQGMLRRLAGRADGLSVFFGLVDPARERFPGTTTHTALNTPTGTAPGTPRVGLSLSRAPSLERIKTVDLIPRGDVDEGLPESPGIPLSPISTSRRSVRSQPVPVLSTTHSMPAIANSGTGETTPTHKNSHSISQSHLHLHLVSSSPTSAPVLSHHNSHSSQSPTALNPSHSVSHSHSQSHSHSHSHSHGHHHHHHHALLHSSLLSIARARTKKPEYAVGTFESQRYLNLEATTLWDPNEEEWNIRIGGLLRDSCQPLLESCSRGTTTVNEWFSTVRDARLAELFSSSSSLSVGNANTSENKTPRKSILDWFGLGPCSYIAHEKNREERVKKIKEVRKDVAAVLEEFRNVSRHAVLEPYEHAVDHDHDRHGEHSAHEYSPLEKEKEKERHVDDVDEVEHGRGEHRDSDRDKDKEHPQTPAHRYLFHCYVYQYNLLQISSIVLEMLDEIIRLEEERTQCRLWTPAERVFSWSPWLIADNVEHIGDDDDPDVIQGLRTANPDSNPDRAPTATNSNPSDSHPHPDPTIPSKHTGPAFVSSSATDLGLPKRRDPDALPPHNIVEWLMVHSYRFFVGLGSDGMLFAVKAGLLTVVLSLPSLIRASAGFAYDNRFIWGIFMGQLTIARFRGETVFGISARIISTFFGAIFGMVIWYISCGSGNGNPYGLAAVCAVCFPFIFFARIYWPIPPMRNIVFFVTIILVVGYSYQDVHLRLPGAPGVGWPVAWKRFVLVTAGVVSAFIASFFPPSTTLRLYQRRLLATTSSELGTIYCAILSFANTKHEPEIQEIISSLIAVRNKLTKSAGLVDNIAYEFSFKGRWPADRYQKIAELQVGISFALSHLMSVLEHLEPAWSRAFLRRTRFMDPGFQGDVLAVISMISSSLRTGNPLPQITPCPLIDRFMLKYHGLDVIHKDAEEDYGLPRTLSMDTLRDEQYLMFSVGISTAFGIINRLDRLMIAVKEIVGEQYHIHGVGFARAQMPNDYYPNGKPGGNGGASGGGGGVEMGPRTNTVHFEPPV